MELELLQIQEKIRKCRECNKPFNRFQLRRENQIYCSRICHRNNKYGDK